jgi:hypothetical protein
MKILKVTMLSLLLVGVAVLGSAFETNAQTTTKFVSYTGTSSSHPIFVCAVPPGSSTPSLLEISGNWDAPTLTAPTCNGGSNKLCAASYKFPNGVEPTVAQVLVAIADELFRLNSLAIPQTFTHLYVFTVTINSVSVEIKIFLKS